ncbi:hypothetical protein FRC07_010603, partial [Ceratobasidium sp. 392]
MVIKCSASLNRKRAYKLVGNEMQLLKRSLSPALQAPTPALLTKPKLPYELIERIADFLLEVRPPKGSGSISICCTKPPWRDVLGFMNTSSQLRKTGYVRWMQVLTIKTLQDWDTAKRYAQWISDVSHNDRGQFAYRDLIQALPPSLRRLEITRAHGPDVRIIATVKECCPDLEELRLGRCTIFNSPSACDFWRAFPLDHDSYMSSQDTDSYGHSLAQELFPLRSLKSLHLGLYLIPSTTVLAHRIYHRRDLPAPAVIEWQHAIPQAQVIAPEQDEQPHTTAIEQLVTLLYEPDSKDEFQPDSICSMCLQEMGQVSSSAETSANAILKERVPSLEEIQWMSWLSPEHM